MSACVDIRTLLLEAEPDELRGMGPGAVASHVRECRACARVAEVLLEETAALDAWLDAESATSVDEVLRRAGAPAHHASGGSARRLRGWAERSGWVALAAAASIALLVLARDRAPGPAPTPVAVAMAEPLPVVQSTPDRTVAVIQTQNPDITVLWFFKGGGDR